VSGVLPLDPDEILVFFREGCLYPIQAVKGVPLAQQAKDNAELNPGTLRVEDRRGNVLWRCLDEARGQA